MTEQTMIERMARAISGAEGDNPDKICGDGRPNWMWYVAEAKAALECLLSPTEAMVDAGWASKPLAGTQYGAEDACVVFTAMIQAALDEETSPKLVITHELGEDGEVHPLDGKAGET